MPYNKKCERAFKMLVEDKNEINIRIKKLENSEEYGFALLIHFIRIEAALKILRYGQYIKEGWPDTLKFLTANWAPLRDLKNIDPIKYKSIIGSGGSSLREKRNQIAHEGCNINEKEYGEFSQIAGWALEKLIDRLPPRHELRKKAGHITQIPKAKI